MKKFLAAAVAAMLALTLLAGAALADPKAYDYWVEAQRAGELHGEPDAESGVVGSFEEGDTLYYLDNLDVDADNGVWYLVSGDGAEGWISALDAQLMGADGVICTVDDFGWEGGVTVVKATGGDSYIRALPNKEAATVGLLKSGSAAIYAGSEYRDARGVMWYYVEFEDTDGDGATGWISSKYTTAE